MLEDDYDYDLTDNCDYEGTCQSCGHTFVPNEDADSGGCPACGSDSVVYDRLPDLF